MEEERTLVLLVFVVVREKEAAVLRGLVSAIEVSRVTETDVAEAVTMMTLE